MKEGLEVVADAGHLVPATGVLPSGGGAAVATGTAVAPVTSLDAVKACTCVAMSGEISGEPAEVTPVSRPVGELREAGAKDAHHTIQDAAVRDLPEYKSAAAPGVELPGPSNQRGTPHYNATQTQRQVGGGTYGAERRIGHRALRNAGMSEDEARQAIMEAVSSATLIGPPLARGMGPVEGLNELRTDQIMLHPDRKRYGFAYAAAPQIATECSAPPPRHMPRHISATDKDDVIRALRAIAALSEEGLSSEASSIARKLIDLLSQ